MIKRIVLITAMLATTALMLIGQQQPPTADEQKGIAAIQAAAPKGVDPMAAAVDDFVQKFPKSNYRGAVLVAVADAYEARGNAIKAQIYYQQTLEADPRNYYAMLMLASELARATKENESDEAAKTDRLNKAEKLAKDGLSILLTAPKPNPAAKDEEWAAVKKDDEALGHEALGMIAMARAAGDKGTKKYDPAISEFKQATEGSSGPRPIAMIRLAGAYNVAGKYADSIAVLEKVLAIKDLPDAYKSVATSLMKTANDAKK
jgi:tetratricopeptide (TPR) repeat protein